LAELGNAWLGRDAETNSPVAQPCVNNIAALTAAPRHYGFHATLRPPMRLATGWNEFHACALAIAASIRPFALPALQLEMIDGFLALTLSRPCAAMHALADQCVRATNPHRAPAGEAELARRRAVGLSPRQESLLQAWGYPYVMQEWRFHLTLTRRLTPAEQAAILPDAAAHFHPALSASRVIDEICLFTQADGDLRIADRLKFG
jgi:hypothetical protein